jgi:ATP-dependent DNA ligase
MSKRHDVDIAEMAIGELRRELMRVRRIVRTHRDKIDDARCWHNDLQLYASVLPEEKPPGRMDGQEDKLLRKCKKYIRRQQCVLYGCLGHCLEIKKK